MMSTHTSQRLVRTRDQAVICQQLRLATTFGQRLRGLLGSKTLPATDGLLIRPANDIHTLAMAYPIDLVMLDRNLEIVQLRPMLKPWRCHLTRTRPGGDRVFQVLELAAGRIQTLRLSSGDRLCIQHFTGEPPL